MHVPKVCLILLTAAAGTVSAASAWGYQDASLSVNTKGGNSIKETLSSQSALPKALAFGPADTLKVILTTTDGKKAKRPHQAFLTLSDSTSGLEESFVINVKENGKGTVSLSWKDIPQALILARSPLTASLTIASFGSSTPYTAKAFDLSISPDPNVPRVMPESPIRYGQKPEINHQFRGEPRSPPKIVTLFFTALVFGTVPVLLGSWLLLGANIEHLSKAFGAAPLSHSLFLGSIFAMEGVFFLYYTSWNLFQTLPAAATVGAVAFLSGTRALSEVQGRRLAGLR